METLFWLTMLSHAELEGILGNLNYIERKGDSPLIGIARQGGNLSLIVQPYSLTTTITGRELAPEEIVENLLQDMEEVIPLQEFDRYYMVEPEMTRKLEFARLIDSYADIQDELVDRRGSIILPSNLHSWLAQELTAFNLSTMARNALKKKNIYTVRDVLGQLYTVYKHTRNLGPKGIQSIEEQCLAPIGLSFKVLSKEWELRERILTHYDEF